MYFVNEFAVRLMMITVLLSLPKMRKIARGLYQKWVDLENNDGKFYLICQLEDTPVNKASTRKDKFTQVNFPRHQRSSRKSGCTRAENAVDAITGVPSPPPLPALCMTSSP